MTRPCYRHLDRRWEFIWWLSHWDLLGAVGATVLSMTMVHPLGGLVFGALTVIFLKYVKVGKPRGYLWQVAYRLGLLGFLPDGVRPPGLLAPPPAVGGRIRRYSAVPGDADDDGPDARHFWSGRRRPQS